MPWRSQSANDNGRLYTRKKRGNKRNDTNTKDKKRGEAHNIAKKNKENTEKNERNTTA